MKDNKDLISLVEKGIYYFINHYSINYQDQQDVYNNCIIKILESYPEYDSSRGVPLNYYLMAKIRGEVKKWIRKNNREIPTQINIQKESDWGGPAEQFEKKFNTKMLLTAIGKLSGRQRQVLTLKYFHYYTYKEIADYLSINYQTVVKHHNRGVSALRKKIK
ncbi:sigma-70 family RNA polymerase sigma factor [Proteinivorax tanatarense]|uniref:Sigma-70 family RNA polymerase sigma factor n=1 Tax=Proteinivorax tanatarense TaxID=1260629 RepID=A0AAU7VMK1_9FIRM